MDTDDLIAPQALAERIGTPCAPRIFDVRRREAFEASAELVPGARWLDHRELANHAAGWTAGREVVVYCAHGHALSQGAASQLRARGIAARVLEGGFDAYLESGAPRLARHALPARWASGPTRWVTRARPRIDRVACPWLISRFVDPDAEFLFVQTAQVEAVARELDAEPYDVPGVALSHAGEACSFDAFLSRFALHDPALQALATIVRGADPRGRNSRRRAPGCWRCRWACPPCTATTTPCWPRAMRSTTRCWHGCGRSATRAMAGRLPAEPHQPWTPTRSSFTGDSVRFLDTRLRRDSAAGPTTPPTGHPPIGAVNGHPTTHF